MWSVNHLIRALESVRCPQIQGFIQDQNRGPTLYKMLFFKLKKKKSPFLYGVWQQSKVKSQPNATVCCVQFCSEKPAEPMGPGTGVKATFGLIYEERNLIRCV